MKSSIRYVSSDVNEGSLEERVRKLESSMRLHDKSNDSDVNDDTKASEIDKDTEFIDNETFVIKVIMTDYNGFCMSLKKPFDEVMTSVMATTALEVSSKLPGCILSFVSDKELIFMLKVNQHMPEIKDIMRKGSDDKVRGIVRDLVLTRITSRVCRIFNRNYKLLIDTRIKRDGESDEILRYGNNFYNAEFESTSFKIMDNEIAEALRSAQDELQDNTLRKLLMSIIDKAKESVDFNLSYEEYASLIEHSQDELSLLWDDTACHHKNGIVAYLDETGAWKLDLNTPDFGDSIDYISLRTGIKM